MTQMVAVLHNDASLPLPATAWIDVSYHGTYHDAPYVNAQSIRCFGKVPPKACHKEWSGIANFFYSCFTVNYFVTW